MIRRLRNAWQRFQMWCLENDAATRGRYFEALYWARRRATLEVSERTRKEGGSK